MHFNKTYLCSFNLSYLNIGYLLIPTMQAHVAHTAQNSSIHLTFGEKHHHDSSTPIQISLQFSLFAEEQRKIRQNLQESLGVELTPTTIVFEFDVANGNCEQLRQKLSNSEKIKQINEVSPSNITIKATDKKIYLIITGDELTNIVSSQADNFSEYKDECEASPIFIKFDVHSHNNLSSIGNLYPTKGLWAWLDSLDVKFSFEKTQLTSKIISSLLQKIMGIENTLQIFQAFKHVNLEYNCSSSRIFDEFPKITLPSLPKQSKNEIVDIFAGSKVENGRLLLLDSTFFLKGEFKVNGLIEHLTSFYG